VPARAPGGQVSELPGSGHYMLEEPLGQVLSTVLGFLQ